MIKQCTKCNLKKSVTEFHKRGNGYKEACKSCRTIERRKQYKNNRDRELKLNTQWRENNKIKMIELNARWAKDNKEKKLKQGRLRALRKKRAIPKWINKEDIWMTAEIYSLAKLRTKLTGVPHEVDHIIPIKNEIVCGLHIPINMRVITQKQNRIKGATFQ